MPAPVDHYAQLHPLEERVLALWDAGLTIERITDELKCSRERVSHALTIVTGGTDHLDFKAMSARGTALLGAAIRDYQERNAA